MSVVDLSRRRFLTHTACGVACSTLVPHFAFAGSPAKEKIIRMNNLHTGESLTSCYFDGRSYVESELDKIDHLCRDFRRDEIHPIDRQLLTQLQAIQKLLGVNTEVQIISGYRSPATNEMLRSQSGGVAKKSYHMQGKAIDFRLPGIELSQVRKAALSLKAGGVGYYPESNFVHIDTGPVRHW
jgi:uncharacterized protein YcbK (DUF882 family)